MRPSSPRTAGDLAIALLFAAMLLAPALSAALGGGRANAAFIAAAELRTIATMPPRAELVASTPQYTRAVERVLGDNFPLRIALIEGYDFGKFFALGDSSSDQVLRGRDGWLFLGAPRQVADITGTPPRPDAYIEYLAEVFRGRADFCRAHGAHYVVIFPPDKSTVYPEFLPPGIALHHPTILERLVPRLRAAGVDVVDPTAAIVAAKRAGEVYSKGDTHWNGRGAYAAYSVLVADLRSSGARPLAAGGMTHQVREREGDLIRRSGVTAFLPDRQDDIELALRARRTGAPQYAEPIADPGQQPYVTEVDDPSLPTAVMFGDSFGVLLRPLVSESFRRVLHVYYGTQPFNEHVVAAERPRVVIQELVERELAESVVQ